MGRNVRTKGFTLIEAIMVIVLVTIIGAIVSPTLIQHAIFTEKYFADEFLSLLRYARLIAQTSQCEVQLAYQNQNQIALFWRSECDTGSFDKQVPSPYLYSQNKEFALMLPQSISLKTSLPIYFSPQGGAYDDTHQRVPQIEISLHSHQVLIDGVSGFAYVKPI